MEAYGSAHHSSLASDGEGTTRSFANFHPTIWGDYFIVNHPLPSNLQKSKEWIQKRIEELIEEVKNMLRNSNNHLEKMELIDTLQRLEVAYHFEKEIDEMLSQIYSTPIDSEDLHAVALYFRLLRQHGYNITANIFNRFKENEGSFKATLRNDMKGLLSLYEAAYLGTTKENILDEALNFVKVHLKSMKSQIRPPFATQLSQSLQMPLHKRITRLETKDYFSIYQEDEGRINLVLELAKLDFHMLQLIHREEIRSISMWWKALGLAKKLSFCRDRVVEIYFWMLGAHFEPYFSRSRIYMTKITTLISVMDDIYDIYGTLEELKTFTDVIQRWDIEAADQLEECLKLYFHHLYNTIKEFEDELAGEEKAYRVDYLKESIKKLSRAYFEEAKWRDEGYVPPIKEYLTVSMVSSTYPSILCASFVGMGEEATKEAFYWVTSFPRIMKALCSIGRLLNDIVSHEFEQERNHVASAVQCYVKEHGTSVQEACEKLREMIKEEWKILNEECLNMTAMPKSLITPIVNLARTSEAIYSESDSYTHSSTVMKDRITSVLVEPIPF